MPEKIREVESRKIEGNREAMTGGKVLNIARRIRNTVREVLKETADVLKTKKAIRLMADDKLPEAKKLFEELAVTYKASHLFLCEIALALNRPDEAAAELEAFMRAFNPDYLFALKTLSENFDDPSVTFDFARSLVETNREVIPPECCKASIDQGDELLPALVARYRAMNS